METLRIAPIFQKAGSKASERVKRIDRAEGMMEMREEMRKLKNMRMKPSSHQAAGLRMISGARYMDDIRVWCHAVRLGWMVSQCSAANGDRRKDFLE
jgi:hypothetical protein